MPFLISILKFKEKKKPLKNTILFPLDRKLLWVAVTSEKIEANGFHNPESCLVYISWNKVLHEQLEDTVIAATHKKKKFLKEISVSTRRKICSTNNNKDFS